MNTHRTQRDIHGFLFKTAAILLMLVLVSTSLVTGRYARYTTSSESSDSARVAKFDVTESGQTLSQIIEFATYPGNTHEMTFSVTNNSEVAVEYRIYAENETNNLPFDLKVGDTVITKAAPFTGTLPPNGSSDTYKLEFQWPAASNNPAYSGMTDRISLKVETVQID